ncbi:hypothetical protein HZ326_20870 [Fusarium oxysporum f. sp. albedinis]|nr:hypothetical protein FOMA001_g3957 [Fusarium oxysporum f. sp. matthiolae]KAJ0136112.1 hypothetical protein HZ326_20870 [Fusarium oxysporum f. sp. albedinis]KAK2480516.1 hypothetical protein H9L39_06155 [Fusarium oxysporum f. sp. albedinis]
MAVPRASVNLLRCGIRPVTRAAPVLQLRQQSGVSSDGDIGGPGSQQTPPPNPGFRETLNRNWRSIAGAGLLVVAALSYMSSSKGRRAPSDADLKAASSTEIGMSPSQKKV